MSHVHHRNIFSSESWSYSFYSPFGSTILQISPSLSRRSVRSNNLIIATDVLFFNTFSDLIWITTSISRSIGSKSVPRISILPFTICIIDTPLIFISIRFEVFVVIATFIVEIGVYNESFLRTLRSILFTFSGTWSHEVIWFSTSIWFFPIRRPWYRFDIFFLHKIFDVRHRFLQIADQLIHEIDHVNMFFLCYLINTNFKDIVENLFFSWILRIKEDVGIEIDTFIPF